MKKAVLFAVVCVIVAVGSVAGQVDRKLVGKWCYDVPGDFFGLYSGLGPCYEFRANGTFTMTESGGFEFSGRWNANGNELRMPTPQYGVTRENYRFNREGTMVEISTIKYRRVATDAEKAAAKKAEEAEKARKAAAEEAERARQTAADEAERVRIAEERAREEEQARQAAAEAERVRQEAERVMQDALKEAAERAKQQEEAERARRETERQAEAERQAGHERQEKLERAQKYIDSGIEYHSKGKFEDAIKFYNLALKLDPNADVQEYLEMAKNKKKLKK